MVIVAILWTAVIVSTFITLRIVFPGEDGKRPFCHRRERRIEELEANASSYSDSWGFSLTEDEVAGIYWAVVFIPSAIVFLASAIYLFAGEWVLRVFFFVSSFSSLFVIFLLIRIWEFYIGNED